MRHRAPLRLPVLALAAALAATSACKNMPHIQAAHGPPVRVEELVGLAWKVEQVGDEAVHVDHPPMLYFENEKTVSGFGGCNQYSGPIKGPGALVTIGPISTTRRACDKPLMDLEQRYLQALAKGPLKLEGGGGFLYMVDEGGTLVVRFLQYILPDEDTGPS